MRYVVIAFMVIVAGSCTTQRQHIVRPAEESSAVTSEPKKVDPLGESAELKTPLREEVPPMPVVKLKYAEAVKRASAIKNGMTASAVVQALGEPTGKNDADVWFWRFAELEGYPGGPPPVGTTVFAGVEVTVNDGKVVNVHMPWMDVTGPAPGR